MERYGVAGAYVTDIGCGRCGLWSYGFVLGAADFGAEIKGLCRRVAADFGLRWSRTSGVPESRDCRTPQNNGPWRGLKFA